MPLNNLVKQKGGDFVEQVLQEECTQIRLPKNVRQIGTIDKSAIIYIEDYVVTYLNQMARKEKLSFGVAALYGRTVFEKDIKYVFISGAVFEEDRPALQSSPNDVIENGPTKAMLSSFHENKEKYFSELTSVGIAVIHSDSVRVPDAFKRKNRMGNLPGRGAVMIDLDTDGDGAEYYFYNEEGIALQEGHYIYYEKNDMMQSFLVEWHECEQTGLSEEPLDFVAGTCRMVMDDKKEDRIQERSANWVSASGLLSLIIISAIGILVMNHYRETAADGTSAMQTSELSVSSGQADTEETINLQTGTDVMAVVEEGMDTGQAEMTEPAEQTYPDGSGVEQTQSEVTQPVQVPETTEDVVEVTTEEAAEIEEAASESVNAGETTESQNISEELTFPLEYRIEKGDTLFGICRRYYGTVERVSAVCEYNQIEDQDSIFYGQTIVLP
ncbi:MAG: LysM peptidoglycan-binding domain-containing protein [Lachnospiraceae bacterium]|nr:LysM peptidoglycan-binding domain-containing protein [Lachnospiraceae bacterium]